MLKEQAKLFNRFAVSLDIFVLFSSLSLAYVIRIYSRAGLQPILDYLWILLFAVPVWYLLLNKNQFYSSIRRVSVFSILSRMVTVHFFGGSIVGTVIFLLQKDSYSRGLYLLFLFLAFFLLTTEKLLLRMVLGYFRSLGYNTRNILIMGTCEKARRFCHLIEDHGDWGLKILGFLQVSPGELPEAFEGYPVLGKIGTLVDVCKAYPVDEAVFCLPKDFFFNVEEHLRDLEELGVTVRMALDFFDFRLAKRELGLFHDEIPILTFHTKSLDAQQLALKRMLDIIGSLVGLSILAVLLPFIAVAIKKDSPGPIFFGQDRVGENGRVFKCLKFRSMYIDAEQRKQELMDRNEMKGAIFKIKDDPRITRVGKFLRRTSLDEFPQFWNVLKGQMSLVGTRPPTPQEVSQYENWQRRRISIKPGITGNWQVSGRNRIEDFDQIVQLDLAYIDSWNVLQDIRILFKTFKVVFAREGSF